MELKGFFVVRVAALLLILAAFGDVSFGQTSVRVPAPYPTPISKLSFSCERLMEMVDYDPSVQRGVFREIPDSTIQISPSAATIRLRGKVWSSVEVQVLPPNQLISKPFYASYVRLLFGKRLDPLDIVSVNSLTLSNVEAPLEARQPMHLFEVRSLLATYRYVEVNQGDLAICQNSPVSAGTPVPAN